MRAASGRGAIGGAARWPTATHDKHTTATMTAGSDHFGMRGDLGKGASYVARARGL
jgi:hypothetical protein